MCVIRRSRARMSHNEPVICGAQISLFLHGHLHVLVVAVILHAGPLARGEAGVCGRRVERNAGCGRTECFGGKLRGMHDDGAPRAGRSSRGRPCETVDGFRRRSYRSRTATLIRGQVLRREPSDSAFETIIYFHAPVALQIVNSASYSPPQSISRPYPSTHNVLQPIPTLPPRRPHQALPPRTPTRHRSIPLHPLSRQPNLAILMR